jgi:hypothetical protein|tara:strand:+ start:1853 stop:2797 length:945 start_codon:yes stop_codon:yes gene_type:complete
MLLLFVLGFVFEKYKKTEAKQDKMDQYELIKKYLLNDSTLARSDKPILWIHVAFETNARWWPHFASRNTECFNQPYQYLTIKSIVDKCGDSFNVCLLDDKSFNKIIPGWSTKVANLPNPLRPHLRELAMAKLLHHYGGMTIPSSFACKKDLISLYNKGLSAAPMFCGELPSKSVVSSNIDFFPTNKIMGCKPDCELMGKYVNFLERTVSEDYTNEMEFTGETDNWLYDQVKQKNIMPLDAIYFGAKLMDKKPVLIDNLLDDDDDFTLPPNVYGLYIPANEILKRTNFQWFARLSAEQVLESNTVIARQLLLCNE